MGDFSYLSCPPWTGSGFGPHGEARDLSARLLRSDTNVVSALKIKPELAAGAEPMSQAQRCITSD
jgi:hypothetical protein